MSAVSDIQWTKRQALHAQSCTQQIIWHDDSSFPCPLVSMTRCLKQGKIGCRYSGMCAAPARQDRNSILFRDTNGLVEGHVGPCAANICHSREYRTRRAAQVSVRYVLTTVCTLPVRTDCQSALTDCIELIKLYTAYGR